MSLMNHLTSLTQLKQTPWMLIVLTILGVLWIYLALDAFMLAFLGLLFGLFLIQTTKQLQSYIPVNYGWTLGLLLMLLAVSFAGSTYYFGSSIEKQISQTTQRVDDATATFNKWLKEKPAVRSALGEIPYSDQMFELHPHSKKEADSDSESKDGSNASGKSGADSGSAASSAGTAFNYVRKFLSTGFGLLTNLFVIFFVGVFIAADPKTYLNGTVQLFPSADRARASEVLRKMGLSMYHWLLGRFITMVITGVGIGLALYFLNVPLAFVVGSLTALLTFVPNIGGIIGLLLAVAMATSQGMTTVAWVVGLYCGWQLIESNIITPLIQQQKTSIPPALLLLFQLFMGLLTGFFGVLVATPLLAAILVLVKEVWIQDCLGDNDVATPDLQA